MKYSFALIAALLAACAVQPDANTAATQSNRVADAPAVLLSPIDKKSWRADFSWTTPVTQLDFVRQSNQYRLTRVKVLDDAFELFTSDNGDAIRRRDGAPFTSVTIVEPTLIEDPPAGYLPFVSFSDGNILLYTGRFHTCAGACPSDFAHEEGLWPITIDPGKNQRMIINGSVETGRVSFIDSGDGTKVYIGDGHITEGNNLLAVIDTAVPKIVAEKLSQLFPPLMDYFGERLGKLTDTQMLFASYNVPGDLPGSSSKGGSLPNQVFMHFEGKQIPERSTGADFPSYLTWFFAHEVAHLHQGFRPAEYERVDSWIHEGSAEAFAYLSVQELQAAPAAYLDQRLNTAMQNCAQALADGPLNTALKRDQPFQSLYDCGLILQLAVGFASGRSSELDLFNVWKNFNKRVAQGSPWNSTTYLNVVAELADEETTNFVESIVTTPVENPLEYLKQGLVNSGFGGTQY